MICSNCGKSELRTVRRNYHYVECGLRSVTLIGLVVGECMGCGAVEPLIPNKAGLHRVLAERIITKDGRFSPEEVSFLRRYLGWSGTEFARNMHSTPPQVCNWESGKGRMCIAADLLLREMIARKDGIVSYCSNSITLRKAPGNIQGLSLRYDSGEWY